ncbi:MAG: hypothetical protein RBT65_12945 [Methanolobus sp.]|nr:hypothetical protein [Methanolobus sp.]
MSALFDKIGKKTLIHDYHRHCLIPAFNVVFKKDKRPFNLILFDAHTDACNPDTLRDRGFKDLIKNTPDLSTLDIQSVCERNLSKNDDDWVIAGMELGIISNVLIVMGTQRPGQCSPSRYKDQTGKMHSLQYMSLAKPNEAFDFNNWDQVSRGVGDQEISNNLWLNFDMDCFTYNNDCNQVIDSYNFERVFIRDGLIIQIAKKSRLVTIAKTLTHCPRINNLTNNLIQKLNLS